MILKILPKYKNYELKIFDKTDTEGIYKNPPHQYNNQSKTNSNYTFIMYLKF